MHSDLDRMFLAVSTIDLTGLLQSSENRRPGSIGEGRTSGLGRVNVFYTD